MKFITSSLAPLIPSDRDNYQRNEVQRLTDLWFDPNSTMVSSNPRHGKYVSTLLTYRGDIIPKDVC